MGQILAVVGAILFGTGISHLYFDEQPILVSRANPRRQNWFMKGVFILGSGLLFIATILLYQ